MKRAYWAEENLAVMTLGHVHTLQMAPLLSRPLSCPFLSWMQLFLLWD